MKVFIRTSELTSATPTIIAVYADDAPIADDAHGEGMSVLIVPRELIHSPTAESETGMPYLVNGWRERAGSSFISGEAKRRIEEAFPISEQLHALHEMLNVMLKYGSDPTKWPADATQRRSELDDRWKYVADVRAKAREHTAVTLHNPSSDKSWPRRLSKK